ncbi:unnamed protein product, partial [Lampetra planeri]
PEPPSSNKWQLDSWLNKVQAQTKPLVTPQQEHHGTGWWTCRADPAVNKEKSFFDLHSPSREKAKAKLSQKASGESQRAKMRLSPGLMSGPEVTTPRRNTTGKKQPRRIERSSSVEDTQNQTWSRTNQPSPAVREKELFPPSLLEHPNPSRPRSKHPSGKTAPRKEPRSATNSNSNTVIPPDKRKHRGPCSKITPKSREFIETDSSSSSSECQSDSEEAMKIPALPPLLGPCTGKGLRVKDSSSVITNTNSSSSNSSISSGSNGNSSSSNTLSITNVTGSFGTSVPDPGGSGAQCKERESISPPDNMRIDLPVSPLREYQEIQSLWVKIDLSLLSRVPGQGLGEISQVGIKDRDEKERGGGKHRRQTAGNMLVPTEKYTSKSKRKHKSDHNESSINSNKKLRLDKDCQLLPPCISPIHNHKGSCTDSSLNRKQPRRHDEKLLPPLLSPLSDEPPQKQTCDGGPSLSQEGGATVMAPCCTTSSTHRQRSKAPPHTRNGGEMDPHGEKACGDGYHANGQSDSGLWSDAVMEPVEPRRPRLSFSDIIHSADYYMQEAKRLKHKADALTDKFGKAVNYADGALSFIDCGNAMERDPLEAKSPYTMYSETVELIRYAMRLKNFTSHSATVTEKKLAVLCNRCLSLLYLRMFHLKKDHAVKYSRSLMEYFKNSAKSSHQAPSPWRINGKINGTPSPLSLSPSPASSGGGGGAGAGSGGTPGSSSSVAIPNGFTTWRPVTSTSPTTSCGAMNTGRQRTDWPLIVW